MQRGTFVSFKGWKIWVELGWITSGLPTLHAVAEDIYKSGWIKNNTDLENSAVAEKETVLSGT